MKFEQKGDKLVDKNDIKELELKYKVILPNDYKDYMLEMNGLFSKKTLYFKPEIWGEDIEFFYVLPIKYGSDIFERANLKDEFFDFPENHITIGVTYTGNISMSLKESEYGSIYVFYSDGEMHKLANSFTEFLEGLKEL